MSRSDVTTHAARRIVVAGAWLRIPSAAPGVLRVRPLPGEATASYTQRLADTYRLTLPQLLDSTGITLHRHGAPCLQPNSTSTTARPSTSPSWPAPHSPT